MSFNPTHIISLSNYEEWFVLYMDNELTAEQKTMVEDFLLLHPHLAEELNLLLGTKLPVSEVVFSGKEELLSAAMKLNAVDEALLLYIDNELPAADKKKMEQRLAADQDYRLQYGLLQKTKVDAAEEIPYPDKNELYRRTERVVLFPLWMRIVAVLLLLLFGSYFIVFNKESKPDAGRSVAIEQRPVKTPIPVTETAAPPVKPLLDEVLPATADITAKQPAPKTPGPKKEQKLNMPPVKEGVLDRMVSVEPEKENSTIEKAGAIQVEISKLLLQSAALNNSVANLPVTSAHSAPLNITDDPDVAIVTDGDDKPKRTPAKGFFRKVSRFIERRTGIGTVNADNELWVGAVALKLN